jgi:hypothetical protein
MSNKKETAVDWFSNKSYEIFEQYSENKFDRKTLNLLMIASTEQAKEMEKEQIIDACDYGKKYHEKFDYTSEQYYKETYTDKP